MIKIKNRTGPVDICLYPQQIFMASAGPAWIDFSVVDDEIIILPDGISNVEKGVGYVTGVYSKTIPYESCWNSNEEMIPCPVEQRLRH